VRAVTSIFLELQIDKLVLEKVKSFHQMAMADLAALEISEERKTSLRELAEQMLGREH
jgi:hypothetical protein